MKNLNQGINIFIDEHSVKQTEFSANSYAVTLTAPHDFNLTGGAKVISFISGMSM